MKKYYFLLLALTLCLKSHAGIQTNGGDGIVAEFLAIFDNLYFELSHTNLNSDKVKGTQILAAMNSKRAHLELKSTPELSIDNIAKDAINYPELNPPLIEISQISWSRLSRVQKAQLVLHEMLPIAGYADHDYALSSWFINKTNLGEDRNGEIKRIFESCNSSELKNIKLFEIKRILEQRQIALPHIVSKGICVEGLRLLIKAGWDLNLCHASEAQANSPEWTPLANIIAFFPRGFREHYKHFDEFKALLLNHGATTTCSGYYKPL